MHEMPTHGIVYAGSLCFRRFVTRKKSRYILIGHHLVIPHDTIPSTDGSQYASLDGGFVLRTPAPYCVSKNALKTIRTKKKFLI